MTDAPNAQTTENASAAGRLAAAGYTAMRKTLAAAGYREYSVCRVPQRRHNVSADHPRG